MATLITEECINCGACLPRCPNNAIYIGDRPWELDGVLHEAIAPDIYYIAAAKCTECVGFFDHEECAAACPVDCCIPDPAIPESEEVLLERAQRLHPEVRFDEPIVSRFRRG
jgi:ferredoxin